MTTIRWPICTLPPSNDGAFNIASRSLAGPASISGNTQVVSSDAGIWRATFQSVHVRRREAVLTFRAIATLLEGRLNPILLPMCRGYQPVLADPPGLYDPTPHEDGSTFGDGSAYVGATVEVQLAAPVAARAVSASVDISYGGTLLPGHRFSIGERGYMLRSVVYTSDTTAAITFRPPLREAAVSGQRLEFDDPVVRMRLASDTEMDLDLHLRRFGQPTVNFIEDV